MHQLRHYFALLIVSLLISARAAATSPAPAAPLPLAERPLLSLGAKSDSYPYSYLQPDGRWDGFAVELFQSVARVMNLDYQPHIAPAKDIQNDFRNGQYDLLHAYSQTTSRDSYADFSVPYLTLQGAIFVRDDTNIKTLADLAHNTFAIIGVDSIGEKFLRDQGIETTKIFVSSTEEGLALVEQGRCAAVFASHLTALSVIELNNFKHIRSLGKPLPDYDIRHCFAVHKGDAQLLARLNEGLAILNRTGEYQEIYRKWFGRFASPVFTREQVISYVAATLALALAAALWGFWRQRTLRKHIAQQTITLAENTSLLHALFENLPAAIIILEGKVDNPRLLTLNPQAEKFLQIPLAESSGKYLRQSGIEEGMTKTLLEITQHWPKAGTIHQEEHTLPNPTRHIAFVLVPLSSLDSPLRRLCLIAEDITTKRTQDAEIAQSRRLRALGELVGGIAHEFNNLLTPVMLKVGEIQTDWANDTRLQEDITIVRTAITRSAELTQRLLAFGRRPDHGATDTRLSDISRNAIELLRLTIDRRITLQNSSSTLPPLPINPTDLHQAVLNLLLNARDTLTEKLARQPTGWTPCIEILTTESLAEANPHGILAWQRLSIKDNGLGIPPDIRERIFEPFFTTKEVGSGTGLGLATVWHFATEAGGRVEVESTPGLGTTFHILLPRLAPVTPKVSPPPPRSTAPTPAKNILLAEDEDLIATALTATLKRAGHQVTRTNDGSAAWEQFTSNVSKFDLLIFDIDMPGITGVELARRAKAHPAFHGKILIISGRITSTDTQELLQIGVDRTLPKPFTTARFLENVHDLIVNK